MTIRYDAEAEALYVRLRAEPVAESEEVRPGVILDLDVEGRVVGLEILSASKPTDDPQAILSFTARSRD